MKFNNLLLAFLLLLFAFSIDAQIIFQDDFEGAEFKPEWELIPNLQGANGLIDLAVNIGAFNTQGVRIGKSSDAGGFTTMPWIYIWILILISIMN